MKTQISHLRSGAVTQALNKEVDYSILPRSTAHDAHAGSAVSDVSKVWKEVITENPWQLRITLNGKEFTLKSNWSGKLKAVYYYADISYAEIKELFDLDLPFSGTARILVEHANIINIANSNYSTLFYICPSFINILE